MSTGTFDTNAVVAGAGHSAHVLDMVAKDNSKNSHPASNLSVHIICSAFSGSATPTVTIEVQWSNDNVTFISDGTPDTEAAITAIGNELKQFPVKGRYARLKYGVSGTAPSATLTATAYFA